VAKVLVIDDDPALRAILLRMLAAAGHHAIEARDGAEGVAAFEREAVDLVVTDIVMPDKEGIGTIIKLRKMAPGSSHHRDVGRQRTGAGELSRFGARAGRQRRSSEAASNG